MSHTPGNIPNIAQVGQMPEAPQRPRDWRGAVRVLAVLVALALIVAAVLVVHARLNPPPANDPVRGQQILTRAEAADLRDTAFTVAGKVGASVAGAGFSTPLNGHGELKHQPQQLHLVLSTQSPLGGALDVEIVEDGTDYYLKTTGLGGGNTSKPWTKTTSSPDGTGGILFTQFLDYRYIQHPLYIGDETINGHDTYRIHADLSSQISGTVATVTPGTSIAATEDLWFAKGTYLPVQIILHAGADSQANSSTISAKVDETFTFTTWNTGLTITVPPPDQVQG
jgi:hypothetical protein